MLTALQRQFTIVSSKVRKVRREQKRSLSNRKVFRSRRNISSDRASPTPASRLSNANFQPLYAVTQKPKVQEQHGAAC